MYYFFLIYKLFSTFVSKFLKIMRRISLIILYCFLFLQLLPAQNQTEINIKRASSLHRSYEFDKAINLLDGMLKNNSDSLAGLKMDSLKLLCINGRTMLEFADRPEVIAAQEAAASSFFLKYPLFPDRSWMPVPESLTGGKKHSICNVMYFPENASVIYFSAPDNSGSWNIYSTRLLNGNVWSAPELVSENLMSSGDEIFPVPTRDGKSLIFSSNGLSGMGGFDLFISTLDDSGEWSTPQNLGFPYSSTGNDYLFYDSADGTYSIFSSDRDSKQGNVRIYATVFDNMAVRKAIDSPEEAREIARLEPSTGKEKQKAASENETGQGYRNNENEDTHYPEYLAVTEEIRSLEHTADSTETEITKSRNLYSSLNNEDDKKAIAKKISEAEMNLMMMRERIYNLSQSKRNLENYFINNGIPIPETDFEEKTVTTTEKRPSVTFANNRTGIMPEIEILKPEPKKDYSFKIGVKPEILDNSELPDGLYYQIQLFTVSNKVSDKALKGLYPIFMEKTRTGKYIYRAGIFYTYSEGIANLNKVRKNGIPGAMLVAFNDHKSVNTRVARELEKKNAASVSYNIVLDKFPNGIPEPIIAALRDACNKDIAKSTEGGKTIYIIGPFGSKSEAEETVSLLEDLAVTGITLTESK